MGYGVSVDKEQGILRCTLSGSMPDDEGRAMVEEMRTRAAAEGYALLYDLTAITEAPGMGDMFSFPRQLDEKGVARPRKIAIVFAAHSEAYRFYETTANNAGHNLRVFDSEADALAWAADG